MMPFDPRAEIEKAKADAEKRMREAEAKAGIVADFESSTGFGDVPLPRIFEPEWSAGMLHAYGADAFAKAKAESLVAAMTIAERCNPLLIWRKKAGGVAFLPDGCDKVDPDAEGVEPAGCWLYILDHVRRVGESRELRFFVRLDGGHILEIRVACPWEPDYQLNDKITFDRRGNASRENVPPTMKGGHFVRYTVFWSPPESKRRVVFHD